MGKGSMGRDNEKVTKEMGSGGIIKGERGKHY
jgi:hypothetical protein